MQILKLISGTVMENPDVIRRILLFMKQACSQNGKQLRVPRCRLLELENARIQHKKAFSKFVHNTTAQEALHFDKQTGDIDADAIVLFLHAVGVDVPMDKWDAAKAEVIDWMTPTPPASSTQLVVLQVSSDSEMEDIVKYNDLSKDDLVLLLTEKDRKLAQKEATIIELKRKHRAALQAVRRKRKTLKKARTGTRDDHDNALNIVRIGKRKLAPRGRIAVALRRNLTNIAAYQIGVALMEDISKDTVARAEIQAAAALIASTRAFFNVMKETLQERHAITLEDTDAPVDALIDRGSACGLNLVVIGWMNDATNSGVWQRRKLHSVILDACHCPRPDGKLLQQYMKGECDWGDLFIHSSRGVSDVLPVDDGTAPGTLSLLRKQLSNMGCVLWDEVPQDGSHPLPTNQ